VIVFDEAHLPERIIAENQKETEAALNAFRQDAYRDDVNKLTKAS